MKSAILIVLQRCIYATILDLNAEEHLRGQNLYHNSRFYIKLLRANLYGHILYIKLQLLYGNMGTWELSQAYLIDFYKVTYVRVDQINSHV